MMKCPECNSLNVACIDSRTEEKTNRVRRRRKCLACDHRWSTMEISAEWLEKLMRAQRRPDEGSLYRKVPVVVEAIHFTRDTFDAVVAFTNGKAHDLTIERRPEGACFCLISTLEGQMRAREGDYIIKGVAGEFYPCKPDIFERTYTEVNYR